MGAGSVAALPNYKDTPGGFTVLPNWVLRTNLFNAAARDVLWKIISEDYTGPKRPVPEWPSQRDLWKLGFGHATVAKALDRLQLLGLVEVIAPKRPGQAATYRVNYDALVAGEAYLTGYGREVEAYPTGDGQDAKPYPTGYASTKSVPPRVHIQVQKKNSRNYPARESAGEGESSSSCSVEPKNEPQTAAYPTGYGAAPWDEPVPDDRDAIHLECWAALEGVGVPANRRLTFDTADALMDTHGEAAVWQQIKALPTRCAQTTVQNPSGLLICSIEDKWILPRRAEPFQLPDVADDDGVDGWR
jgi:hypothetical protein